MSFDIHKHLLDKESMEKFYLACGYHGREAGDRAERYLRLQQKMVDANEALDEMLKEDTAKFLEEK